MTPRATSETQAYKVYAEYETSIRKQYASGEINAVQFKNRLRKNIETLVDKENLARKGKFCLLCNKNIINCNCKEL